MDYCSQEINLDRENIRYLKHESRIYFNAYIHDSSGFLNSTLLKEVEWIKN